jgi:hypothetical protein
MKLINIVKATKEVYREPKYYSITVIFAILIYSLNVVSHNPSFIIKNFSFLLLYNLVVGFIHTVPMSSFIFLIIIAILGGISLTYSVYLLRRQIKSNAYASSSSIIASILAPACPSCALGLFGILGLGGFLAALPFKGLELGILAIIVLIISIYYLSNKILTKSCEIKN